MTVTRGHSADRAARAAEQAAAAPVDPDPARVARASKPNCANGCAMNSISRCRSSTSWRRWRAREDGMTHDANCRASLMVSNGNVTGIIDRLVAEKLVLRQAPAKTAAPSSCG